MACLLTSGRDLGCQSGNVGGLKTVYFADFGTLGAATITAGAITALAGTPDWFQFDLKGSSNMETTVNSGREAGTFYTQTLNLTLPILDALTQEQIKLIVSARPHVAVADYNGNFFLLGLEHGADVTGGTIVTGGAMGDLSGFTLTLEGQETAPAYFVTPAVITDDASSTKIDPNA